MASAALLIRRRGFTLARRTINEFLETTAQSKVPGLGSAPALRIRSSPMRLLLIRFLTPQLLQRFLNMVAVVAAHSAAQGGNSRILLLPRPWVRRSTAAASIVATVRSFISRYVSSCCVPRPN
jgi:hypothetical protein